MAGVLAELAKAVATLERLVGDLEPGCFDVAGAKKLVDLFTRGERLCAAGRGLAAGRVEEAMAWKQEGHRFAAHWLASATGVSVGTATRSLQTARRRQDLPATQEAFRAGELSEAQAARIAQVASLEPGTEGELLDAARSTSFKGLRDACRKASACARDDAAWAVRRAGARRHDRQGLPRGPRRGTPRTHRRLPRRRARRADPQRAVQAHRGSAPRREAALARGYVKLGERCEIDGVGPVPATTARHLLDDARITVPGTDGTDITTVSSPNRTIPALLRRWLEATYLVCGVDGCAVDHGLEIDHVVPVEEHNPTTKENTWRICRHHHKLKTYMGWRVVETAPGTPTLVPPDTQQPGRGPP